MALPATLALLCVVCTLVGGAHADCSAYQSCADCVCDTPNFGRDSSCKTVAKCGWCPSTSTCYSSPQDNDVNCPDLVGAWQVPEPADDDDEAVIAEALCELPLKAGTRGVSILMLTLGALMIAYIIYANRCRQRTRLVDAAWLRKIAVAHMPNGEPVEWEGCSERLQVVNKSQRKVMWPMIIGTVLVTLPTLIWLLVGLPNITDGSFGFFFPVLYIGGLGTLGFVTLALVTHGTNTVIYGYAISNQHVVEASADLGKRVQKTVQLHQISTIQRLHVTGTSVGFWSGSANVIIHHQKDTAQLYQCLQQRSATDQVLPAGAGIGGDPTTLGAEPPASLDPSGNPIKLPSFGGPV